MDVEIGDSLGLCHGDGSLDMIDVAVDASVGHEAEKVKSLLGIFGRVFNDVIHGMVQGFVFIESSVLCSLGDVGKLLINYPAGSYIKVSDFGITHLTVRETDVFT